MITTPNLSGKAGQAPTPSMLMAMRATLMGD